MRYWHDDPAAPRPPRDRNIDPDEEREPYAPPPPELVGCDRCAGLFEDDDVRGCFGCDRTLCFACIDHCPCYAEREGREAAEHAAWLREYLARSPPPAILAVEPGALERALAALEAHYGGAHT